MKVIYIGYPVSKQNENSHIWSIADNNMENGFIDQLMRLYGVKNVHIFSLDLKRQSDSFLFKKSITENLFKDVYVRYVSYINIPRVRVILIYFKVLVEILKISRECKKDHQECVVIVYNISEISILFNIFKKFSRFKTICFLAGVVENFECEVKNNNFSNILRKIAFSGNDGIISFNKNSINDYFKKDNHLVIFPGVNFKSVEVKEKEIDNTQIVILFTGEVTEHNGISIIIDSMKYLPTNYKLNIYGRGDLVKKVVDISKYEERIQYCGFVSNTEALEMQRNADILVLLRTGSSNLSRYAISSKVVEYLQSGTPIIANKVESLPLEFYNYINMVEASSVDVAEKVLCITKNKSIYSDNLKKSEMGVKFVKENCNWKINGDKIGLFLLQLFKKEDKGIK